MAVKTDTEEVLYTVSTIALFVIAFLLIIFVSFKFLIVYQYDTLIDNFNIKAHQPHV
jgi:hypothetical protein